MSPTQVQPDIKKNAYLPILDGWRALSILFVLSGHWLPIGPSNWEANESIAAAGMALFFCLSGFLITQFLYNDSRVGVFLIKRVFRIIPLAWAAILVLVIANGASGETAAANFLFVANLPPAKLMSGGEHLWSLGVEFQFYFFMAMLVLVGGKKALFLVPVFALTVTLLRVYAGEVISIVTWHRVDEIFVGGCVALAWNNKAVAHFFRNLSPLLAPGFLIALILVSLPQAGVLGYARPYAAGAAIFASLFAFPQLLTLMWTSKPARYVAQISYALYVIHGMLTATVLGGADAGKVEKYILRVPLALLTWLLSHVSTFYYERAAINVGHRLAEKLQKNQ